MGSGVENADKSDWFWSFKTGMSLHPARGPDIFQHMTKGTPGDEVDLEEQTRLLGQTL